MAMSCTNLVKALTLTALACAGLSGCMPANAGLSPDFGLALKQNLAAQVADPDAVYDRTMEPASNGQRAADASDRYVRGEVTVPRSQGTSQIGGSNGGSGGGAGASGGRQ